MGFESSYSGCPDGKASVTIHEMKRFYFYGDNSQKSDDADRFILIYPIELSGL